MQQQALFDYIKPEIVNVAKVKQLSPFRYPGGKTWLVPKFVNWLQSLPYRPDYLVEPFAGGGIISLSAAYYKLVDKCIMIEKDEDVASVWESILYGDWKWLVNKIVSFNLTPNTAKKVIEAPAKSIEESAFKTILRNRVNHGGILADGTGMLKHGEAGKGILSRWYPETLAKRIRAIAAMKNRIEFHRGDAFDYIRRYSENETTAFFVDPPYTASKKKAGKRLYRYSKLDHEQLFTMLKVVKGKFMLTYDFDENILKLVETNDFYCCKVPMKGTHLSVRNELIILNITETPS
jgi:DNA adenine methylase